MEMAWGWMRHAAAGILLLGLSFSANAERYWLDNFADANRTHYATGEEACNAFWTSIAPPAPNLTRLPPSVSVRTTGSTSVSAKA
jgi:hypothetical protein